MEINKIKYSDIDHQQLVDIRENKDYQKSAAKGSLSLRLDNIVRFPQYLLANQMDYVFIVYNDDDIADLQPALEAIKFKGDIQYFLASDIPIKETKNVNVVSAEDYNQKKKTDYTLVDLRLNNAFADEAKDYNSINIPLENLQDRFNELNPKKTTYLICNTANRATVAASYLTNKGFDPVVISDSVDYLNTIADSEMNFEHLL